MSLEDPRLQSLRRQDRSNALVIGFGGLVFVAGGASTIVYRFLAGESLWEQIKGGALALLMMGLGLVLLIGAVRQRPEDQQWMRWITTERDQVLGWKIRPGSGRGALLTQIVLYPKKGEDVTFSLVRGKEAPVLEYLTEHLPRLDG